MSDTTARLDHLNPTMLTKRELLRYASLVAPDKLPQAWKDEIARLALQNKNH